MFSGFDICKLYCFFIFTSIYVFVCKCVCSCKFPQICNHAVIASGCYCISNFTYNTTFRQASSLWFPPLLNKAAEKPAETYVCGFLTLFWGRICVIQKIFIPNFIIAQRKWYLVCVFCTFCNVYNTRKVNIISYGMEERYSVAPYIHLPEGSVRNGNTGYEYVSLLSVLCYNDFN